MEPISTVKRRGNPAMRKGAPSINMKGRPRVGLSIAEATREKIPPEEYVSRLLALADTATSEQVRLSALLALGERGYGKVATDLNVHASASSEPRPFRDLGVDELRARLASARAQLASGDPTDEA